MQTGDDYIVRKEMYIMIIAEDVMTCAARGMWVFACVQTLCAYFLTSKKGFVLFIFHNLTNDL